MSPEWKNKVGLAPQSPGRRADWQRATKGVAQYVQRIKGAIIYVEYAYAKKNKFDHIQLKNRDGQFVQPEEASFAAASAGADWKGTPGMGVILTDQPGAKSWLMTSASFIPDARKAAAGSVKRGTQVLRLGIQERPEVGG